MLFQLYQLMISSSSSSGIGAILAGLISPPAASAASFISFVIGGIAVKHPYSIWLQCSSISFGMAGMFSDLLIIRLCLATAYTFLFINCLLGSPLWPLLHIPNTIQLDGMIWATINLYIHLSTVYRLWMDEQIVNLYGTTCTKKSIFTTTTTKNSNNSDELVPLWRMFYRTGGISQRVFASAIGQYCTVITDVSINDVLDTKQYFYILYEGAVQIIITDEGNTSTNNDSTTNPSPVVIATRIAISGQIFDFRSLGMLSDSYSTSNYTCTAIVRTQTCKLFRFNITELSTIVTNPKTRLMWKEILMESLLRIVERYLIGTSTRTPSTRKQQQQQQQDGSTTNTDDTIPDNTLSQSTTTSTPGQGEGGDGGEGSGERVVTIQAEYINPIFAPLNQEEIPDPLRAGSTVAYKYPFQHIGFYMKSSFAPPWPFGHGPPVGLRHTQLLPLTQLQQQQQQQQKEATTKQATAAVTTDALFNNNKSNQQGTDVTEYSISDDQQQSLLPKNNHHNNNNTPTTASYGSIIITTTSANQSATGTATAPPAACSYHNNMINYVNDLDEEIGGVNFISFQQTKKTRQQEKTL